MASFLYDSFLADVFAGNCNTTHTYKVTLHTSSYVPSQATHNRFDDVTNEVTGTGYTAGGTTVALSTTTDTTNHKMTLSIASASWTSSTITLVRYAVVRRARGGAASADELVCVLDNGANASSSGTTFSVGATTWEIPFPSPV